MPNGLPNLILENFTLTITPEQVRALIQHTVEAQNPGYTVAAVSLEIHPGYDGGYGQRDTPPSLTGVEVKLKKPSIVFNPAIGMVG